jgi:hypothetical protein
MADLLSSDQKLAYRNVFNDIHDTFAREIIIFKIPKRTVISSNLNYNFAYSSQQDGLEVTYTPVSGIFMARIAWLDPSTLNGYKDIKEEVHGNIVKLKVKKDVFDFLDNAKHVEIDGRSVQFFGSSQPHGLFGIDFYNIYYEETN